MNPADLIEQLEEKGIEPVDNSIIAARMETPPPPTVTGLAPPGVYDLQQGYDVDDFPLTSQFQEDLGEPAVVPDIQNQFRNNFPSEEAPEPDLQNDLNTKPDFSP